MEPIEYIYQCVTQTLALEEAGVVSRKLTEANVRYIKQQLEPLISGYFKRRAEEHAAATVQAVKDRL